jgi:hypothetical protein
MMDQRHNVSVEADRLASSAYVAGENSYRSSAMKALAEPAA